MSINLSLDNSDFAIPITISTMKTHARLLLKKEERMSDNWIPFSVDLICYNDRWIVLNAENIEIEEGQYHYEFQLRGMNGEWTTVSDGRLNYELVPGQENPSFPDEPISDECIVYWTKLEI